MQIEVFSLANGQCVVHVTARIDVGGKRTVHGHAEDELLLCDGVVALAAVQFCEALHTNNKRHTVDPHLYGFHSSDGSDYPDTKFSRNSHLRFSFLALVVYNNRCTCVLSQQKMATPVVKCKRVVLFLLSLLYIAKM